jgi:hypothetical protein
MGTMEPQATMVPQVAPEGTPKRTSPSCQCPHSARARHHQGRRDHRARGATMDLQETRASQAPMVSRASQDPRADQDSQDPQASQDRRDPQESRAPSDQDPHLQLDLQDSQDGQDSQDHQAPQVSQGRTATVGTQVARGLQDRGDLRADQANQASQDQRVCQASQAPATTAHRPDWRLVTRQPVEKQQRTTPPPAALFLIVSVFPVGLLPADSGDRKKQRQRADWARHLELANLHSVAVDFIP